jgi:phosphoglycolate phosphatase
MHELTIVFDLDGTLVDTAPDLVAATNHALADLDLDPVGAGALRPFVSLGARGMIVEGLRLSGRNLTGSEIDALLARFLIYYEANIARDSRPFPGAEEAILELAQLGARLAVCTNKREALSCKLLDELDLTRHFAAVAGRDTFPVSKPHPEHLTGTVRKAGGDPRRAIMVGDTNVDIETARNAALPSVAVRFGYSAVPVENLKPDISINHFCELTGAIQTLRPRLVTDAGN